MEKKSTQVKIQVKDIDMASVICQNNKDSIYALSKRLNLEVEEHWGKEVLATVLKDFITESPEYLLTIYNKDMIDFLVMLWESEEATLGFYDWSFIGQLKLLGLIDLRYPGLNEDGQTIYMVKEAKDAFYFYLKSKSAKRSMERYARWELILRGMMGCYGIISFQRLYFLFCKMIKGPIDDLELHRFLSSRIDLLHYGCFAIEKTSGVEYYQNYDVTNPENVLDKRQMIHDLEYYLPSEEEVIGMAQNDNIGQWEGVSQIADVFLNLLEVEYYKTVIAVKTSILMMQNGDERKTVEEHLYTTFPQCKIHEEKIKKALGDLYYSVPVFGLKGWSRGKISKKKGHSPVFTIVKGGKYKDKEKGGRLE